MKKLLILILLLAPLARAITDAELDVLIPALIQVESGGDNFAKGDGGKAVGCLQIWLIMVEDVNRISGRHFVPSDRTSRERSVEMCRIYLKHYARWKTVEQAARIWNGGPSGDKKPSTEKYWLKVKKEMGR